MILLVAPASFKPTWARTKQFSVRRRIALVCFHRREKEADGCSDSPFAGNAYMTIDQPHESGYLRQAQSSSSFSLGREEWIKDPSGYFWRHALPVVLDLNSSVESWQRRIDDHGIHSATLRADLDGSALRQRVARIEYEVENRGIELRLINEASRYIRRELEYDADFRAGTGFQERFQTLQALVNIPHIGAKIVIFRKDQELGGQLRAAENPVLRLANESA